MLKNARNGFCSLGLRHAGCSCHNTVQARRILKHAAKQREARQWKADVR